MTPAPTPLLAVQIVTWNHADEIGACLASLRAQTHDGFETIVLDNASRDASADRAEAALAGAAGARVVREPSNRGFCGGHNRALALSRAPWVLLLNPDATLPPDFVARFAAVAAALPSDVGTVAPLILRPDGTIDSSGLFLDAFRRVYDRGQGERPSAALREEDVFGCTGAVAIHRRAMLEDVAEEGLALDERLFAYYDDLDLAWRAQLRGWRCRFVPSLVAEHARAGRNAVRSGERTGRVHEQRLAVRNRLLVLLKCERARDALVALPRLLPYELARLAYVALRAPGSLPAYADALRAAPAIWRSRRLVHGRARPERLLASPFFPHRPRESA